QLTFGVGFTDGSAYSTDAAATDSGFMAWAISPVATGATISSEGVLNTSAVTPGTVLTITATGNDPYDAETDSIEIDTCLLNEACIDLVDFGEGKLITSSPSVAYISSIGGRPGESIYTEDGSYVVTGDFYQYTWGSANAVCDTYNLQSVGGRTDWRLPETHEWLEAYGVMSSKPLDSFANWSWGFTWSATTDGRISSISGDVMYDILYFDGSVHQLGSEVPSYVSCISYP
ncbi:hypothetical protein AB4428_24490, partial [Vibrio lentus]